MKRIWLALILPLLLCGCTHTVKYKLTEQDRWTGPKLGGVLCVQPIVDHTTNVVVHHKIKHAEGGAWRSNYRGGYTRTNLTQDVTAMIAKHLGHSGLFKQVITDTNKPSDYTLSGALTEFETMGRVNQTAEGIQAGSAGFGLLGALIGSASTSGMKSEIRTSVKLEELLFADKSGRALWHDSVNIYHDVEMHYQAADSAIIYRHPDDALKEAVALMIPHLATASATNQTGAALH